MGRRRCSGRLLCFQQPGLPIRPHLPGGGLQRELPGPPTGICQRRHRRPLRHARVSAAAAGALVDDRFTRRGRRRHLGHVTRRLEQSSTSSAVERPAGRAGNQRGDHTPWLYGGAGRRGPGGRHRHAVRPTPGPVPGRDPDRFPRYAGGFRHRRRGSGAVLLPCMRTAKRVACPPLWHAYDLARRCPVARQRPGQPADDRARRRSGCCSLGLPGSFLMIALTPGGFGDGSAG